VNVTDQNGLFSTVGDVTRFAGVMAQCVYTLRRGGDRLSTSIAPLPSAYFPYVERDIYLQLPNYVTRCNTPLTFQLFSAQD
jgi:hypothetical protein